MKAPTPEPEHHWLQKLVGEWSYSSEFIMGPGLPSKSFVGTETVRSIGGLWTIGEGAADHGSSIMTLGYDPKRKRFVGSFIASMMTFLWLYDGSLDTDGKILTLNSEGPSFSDDGTMSQYRDIIEFIDDDHRRFTAHVLKADGEWNQFMDAMYTRKN